MWYVVQVRTGTEENICLQCQRMLSEEALKDCFIPYYEEQKRMQGRWMLQKKILFPGYVFLVSENMKALYQELRNVIGLTKLIGTGEEIVPLSDREIAILQSFGGEEQVVSMSEGIIEGTLTRIYAGPLMGKEGYIKKIDRHKRKAWLEVELFGRTQMVQVGLEIVERK